MIKSKAPTESPEAKATRLAEEARADKANLESTQEVLGDLTRRYSRRYGIIKSSYSPTVGGTGLAGLLGAAAAGGGSASAPTTSTPRNSIFSSLPSSYF